MKMVPGSQKNEGGSSLNSLFGSSETLQDNIKDLFWKLSEGSGDPGITVEAILRQVRQPGANTSEETSAELVSYLEKVGSLLTRNPVRLIAKAENVDSRETQLQHTQSSTQVYPVNTLLLTERFRQRQGTNGNPTVEALPPSNNVLLALPAPAVCTREETKQNTTTSPSSLLNETTHCSEEHILPAEDALRVYDGANVEESCMKGSGDQKLFTRAVRKDEKQGVEQDMAVVEAEPKTEASAWDLKMMAFCSLLVGSTVMATVSSLVRNDNQTSTGNGGHCDLNTASSFEDHRKVSDEALMPVDIRKDLDLIKNASSTSKEVGTQHEEVIDTYLTPCDVTVSHIENKHTLPESDTQVFDEIIPNAICLSGKCVEQRKSKVPESIESSITRALTSLRPDDESTSDKRHFFNLEDNSYQEAINAIHEQIGEFDYRTLKQKISKEYHHSLLKYEADITQDQCHFTQEVLHPSAVLEELETLEEWKRSVRVEVKRRLERERTGPSKPDQGSPQSFANATHKAQVPDLVTNYRNLSPKGIDKTSLREKTCVEDCRPCGSVQGKKRGHVEIQRLSTTRDRHEDSVEVNPRSRKKPKPQIAFGRRVYKSEKENKADIENKQQPTKNTSSDRKRPRSVAVDPLYSDLNKVDVYGPEDAHFNGEDSFIDTLVNVLLSKSTTKSSNPDVQESSVDLGVEDPHQVEDVMHVPMLDITNQKEKNGMENDVEDHDFVEELVNLFPIADVVLSSQLSQKDPAALTSPFEEGVADCMDNDNKTLLESSKRETNSQEGVDEEQVVKCLTTELVVHSAETRALKDQQNTSDVRPPPLQDPNANDRLPKELPKDSVCPQTELLKEPRPTRENSTEENTDSQLQALDSSDQPVNSLDPGENLQKTQHLLRLDNDSLGSLTSSDENLPAFETGSSATISTSESTNSQPRMKDQRHWKDFKKRHLVQRRERLYTKHGIFDPLLFTSSEVETTSESDFSTSYAKQATSSSIAIKETLK